jgi:glycosyltransferase involved in cell wall biosynthesis
MKRIGIDVTSALTQGGGIGRYTRELIQALIAADKGETGCEYHFFQARLVKPSAGELPDKPFIRRHAAPLNEAWLYRLWYRLRLPLPVQWVTGKLDLFHSPDFVLPPIQGNIPTLLTVHDLSFVHYPHTFTPALVNYLNRVVPWSVARASHILADSEATRQDLVQLWQVDPAKITVLYSGVSHAFRPVTEKKQLKATRRKYGLGDAPYLFSVSSIQPRKNFQLLIRAFKPIAAQWPHNLVIAGGKGWLYDEILAEVGRQGLDGRVLFTGFVDDGDLPALYTGATLFLFPSLYEGFGLPILEAMACGTPVVASNASCLPEVVDEAGRLLPPEDETAWTAVIHELLDDPAQRGRLAADGFLQSRQFSWSRAGRQLLALYQEMTNDE